MSSKRDAVVADAREGRHRPGGVRPPHEDDPAAEYEAFYALGIDGVFSDFPDMAVKAR